jgi:hypothetical protein
LGYQNRLTGNAPQAQAVDVITKSSVRKADDTLKESIQSQQEYCVQNQQQRPLARNSLRTTNWSATTIEQSATTALDQCNSLLLQQQPLTMFNSSLNSLVIEQSAIIWMISNNNKVQQLNDQQQQPLISATASYNSNSDSSLATALNQCNSLL